MSLNLRHYYYHLRRGFVRFAVVYVMAETEEAAHYIFEHGAVPTLGFPPGFDTAIISLPFHELVRHRPTVAAQVTGEGYFNRYGINESHQIVGEFVPFNETIHQRLNKLRLLSDHAI